MATKDLLCSHHARMAVLRGVSTLSRAVKVTLGPGGQHAMIQQPSGAPIITKDGVTVANCVDLENPYENVGARLVKDAVRKTNELTGDGTTTAIVLAEAIIREGIRHITAGASPPAVKWGIDRATELVVAALRDRSRPCDTPQAIMQVATVAADSDPVIGALIADAIRQVGREGAIAIEDGGQLASRLDIREGLQFEGGVLSPAFFTGPERRELTLDRPRILLCGSDISRLDELLPLLEQSRESGSPLVIVVGGMTSQVLSALLLNVRQGALQLAVVRAPSVGDHRRDLLEDVATLTGGIIVADVGGQSLSRLSLNQLGRASRAVIREDRTTIFGGAGDSTEVAARQAVARVLLTGTASQEERKTLQKRLANLTHRMAVI